MEVWFRSFSFHFMGDGYRFQPFIFQLIVTDPRLEKSSRVFFGHLFSGDKKYHPPPTVVTPENQWLELEPKNCPIQKENNSSEPSIHLHDLWVQHVILQGIWGVHSVKYQPAPKFLRPTCHLKLPLFFVSLRWWIHTKQAKEQSTDTPAPFATWRILSVHQKLKGTESQRTLDQVGC